MSGSSAFSAREQHVGCWLAGRLRVNDRQHGDRHTRQRDHEHGPPVRIRLQQQGQPLDGGADHGGGHPDHDRPAELGPGGLAEARYAGQGQRERAQPGQVVQADEDERADARPPAAPAAAPPLVSGRPARTPPSARRRPVRGEPSSVLMAAKAPEARQHRGGLVAAHARRASRTTSSGQAAAERDQRHLRAEHGAEDQRRQRRQDDSGKLNRGRRRMHAKPPAGDGPPLPGRYRMASPARTPPTARTGSGHHIGSVAKPQPVRKVGEDLFLQVADQRQEAVGDRGDRHAQDRGQHQQPQVVPAAQQGARIRQVRRPVSLAERMRLCRGSFAPR